MTVPAQIWASRCQAGRWPAGGQAERAAGRRAHSRNKSSADEETHDELARKTILRTVASCDFDFRSMEKYQRDQPAQRQKQIA